jgi:hypothetical protein
LIPSLFFSLICVSLIGYTQKELVVLLGLTAFIFKFLFGGFRLAAQVWTQDKDKVFYFFSLLETVLLWLVLNPLLT